ncbi:hypothetical protein ASE86_04145 [Sphingomonas sp. Leaf33]|uniref:HEAT repeat domain-containing protein n=1 Tax=Sphingomonas sp. Leaf33 TaxID=1736215 RepID=UPI0006FAFD3E|nr:HEAT repeat domain-containing protein [Sphingomonas sp. Leaf33]KQN25438.1 hypothetical protein ASE86_04145 [Sphingomonas sp. Leaf33]
MLASPPLSAWLADREAQRTTLDRSVAAHVAWRDQGAFAQLVARLDQAGGDRDGVVAIAMDVLDDVDLAHRYVADMLAHLAVDPFFTPPLRSIPGAIGQGIRLFDHPDLSVSLITIRVDSLAAKKRQDPNGRVIAFSGDLALRRMIRAGDATVHRFVAVPAGRDFRLASHPSCRPGISESLSDGDLFVVDGACESFTFAHARSAIVYLECTVLTGRAPFRVEYDAATFRPLAASSTDLAASRVQLMLSTLGALETPAVDLPLYDRLLVDTDFAVRWHTVRELMRVDPASAWPRLARLADDPHPDIAAAAARALHQREAA